jgi:subtilisin family serine protease
MKKLGLILTATLAVVAGPHRTPSALSDDGLALRARLVVRLGASRASGVPLASPDLSGFREAHGLRSLAPVHAGRATARARQGVSDGTLSARVRGRFPGRARRGRGEFRPPDLSRTFVVERTLASRGELESLIRELALDPRVERVEEDAVVRLDFVPDDPYFSTTGSWGQAYADLWGLKKISAPAAWDRTAGEGITVAIVDTGIDRTHPDLAANVWENPGETPGNGLDDDGNGFVDDAWGWDFVGPASTQAKPDADPRDGHGHGTHVAGTVAAVGNNGIGVVGVAWKARVMAVKGLDDWGYGYDSQLAAAIVYAADSGADVINASWGGRGDSLVVEEAVDYAASLGVVFVAAAGNSSDDARRYHPAGLETAITVAASDANDRLASFSNWGNKIDVAAPGVDVLSLRAAGTTRSTVVGNDYVRMSGTSMAAPHVSGLAALVLALHPEFSTEQVRQAIRASASDVAAAGFDPDFGYGRVNAAAAAALGGALEARIQAPEAYASLDAPTPVRGLARGPGLVRYELAFGAGDAPSAWTVLQEGPGPVGGGELGRLDASALPDGLYTLRLQAFDGSGRTFVDRRPVVVNRVAISSPPPPSLPTVATTVKPGATIPVEGRATGGSFVRYRVEWARGINPASGWSEAGVELAGGGLSPVDGGLLASWDTTGLTTAGYCTLRLVVENAGYAGEARSLVYLEPDLLSAHWPRFMDQPPWPDVGAPPARTGSGERTLVVLDAPPTRTPNRLWRFSADGSTVRTTEVVHAGPFQAAVADLGGLPGDEVISAGDWGLRVIRPDDTISLYASAVGAIYSGGIPVVADLDGDHSPELVGIGTDFGLKTGYLEAWRADGQRLGGAFPVEIPDQNQYVSMSGEPRLLVADFDGDGGPEIVLADGPTPSSFSLRLFGPDGSPRPFAAPSFSVRFDRLVAGDIDGDGKLEILVAAVDETAWDLVLHALGPDGTEKPGWPVSLPSGGSSYVALADLDRDGRSEVVAGTLGRVYVLGANGQVVSSVWPRAVGYGGGPAGLTVADLDGDGFPEILVSTWDYQEVPDPLLPMGPRVSLSRRLRADGTALAPGEAPVRAQAHGTIGYYSPRLVALTRNGGTLKSWQLLGAGGREIVSQTTPVVTDVDGDGRTDIVLVSATASPDSGWTDGGVTTVLATGAPYRPGANDWPHLRHDSGNTAVLPRDRTAPAVTLTAPAPGATITDTTLVTAEASDDVFVRGVQFRIDGDSLGAEDTAPPFRASLDPRATGNGPHVLTAVARDAAGNLSTSAPVPITVDVDRVPPAAAITSPAAGDVVSGPTTVAADASDDRGVARVELHVDGALVGTDTAPPWAFEWDARTMADGSHTLVAKAWDAASNSAASEPVAVTVAVPPVASITAPAAAAVVSGVVSVAVSATDNTSVARVELLADGVLVGTDATAPYSFAWDTRPLLDGGHSLLARAYDAAGHAGTSPAVAVTVANPPVVAITAPPASALVTGTVTVAADASDPSGVARVEFLVDGGAVATDVEAPWAFEWDTSTVAEGSHVLAARAFDAAGNVAAATRVVTTALPPTVSITSPAPGAVVGGTVAVTVEASDNGRVMSVELRVDGALAGFDNAAPWVFALDTAARADGPHTLEARAVDNLGATGTSPPVAVTTVNKQAHYDPVLKAPACATVGPACDSFTLLRGRGTVGPEPNQPNTLGSSCADGSYGIYHSAESNDRIRVQTLDGSNLTAGRAVRVEATVWAYSGYTGNRLDLYHAPDAKSPQWTLLGTLVPSGPGQQVLSTTFTLPPGSLQAVRARFRYSGSAAPCGLGSYDDHDDLAFAVDDPADVQPPTVSIASPAEGTTVSGDVVVSATAADDRGVARVEFLVDGTVKAVDTTAPYSYVWPAQLETAGSHTLAARATDVSGKTATSALVTVVVAPPPAGAAYDPVLRAPRCAAPGSVCDSGTLLVGRGTKGPEPNAPNTIGGSCADGTGGSFHVDESIDRLRVWTLDGTPLAGGKRVRIEATVWAYSGYSSDKLDLYYAVDGTAPTWTYLTTLTPTAAGAQTLSTTFTLPYGSLQALRARFRWGDSAAPCGTGSYDDHDDLLFRVE